MLAWFFVLCKAGSGRVHCLGKQYALVSFLALILARRAPVSLKFLDCEFPVYVMGCRSEVRHPRNLGSNIKCTDSTGTNAVKSFACDVLSPCHYECHHHHQHPHSTTIIILASITVVMVAKIMLPLDKCLPQMTSGDFHLWFATGVVLSPRRQ